MLTMFRQDRFFAFIFVAVFVVRAFLSGYLGLSDDEAYYWDWSRNMEWSYYDHPGMVAWLIKFSTMIFGHSAFAVRFPALLFNSLSLFILWRLAREVFDLRVARITGLLYLLTPIFSLGGLMVVPDIPMGFFWMLVLLVVWGIQKKLSGARNSDVKAQWYLVGLLLGLGFLSKYSMILLGGSLIVYMLLHPDLRGQFGNKHFWLAMLGAIFLTGPVWIWNSQHAWPSFYFHLVKRQSGGGGASLSRWLEFWVSQLAFLTPIVFVLGLVVLAKALAQLKQATRKNNLTVDSSQKYLFVLCFSLPVLLVFSSQALFAPFKPHWPAPGYMVLLMGISYVYTQMQVSKLLVAIGVGIFVIPINLLFYAQTVYPVVPKVLPLLGASDAKWEARFDPTNDMYGWDLAANKARELKDQMQQTTGEAVHFASHRYQLNGSFAFALNETVLCLSPGQDHYDFSQQALREQFAGQSALFVSDNRYALPSAQELGFAQCENVDSLLVYRYGILAREFTFSFCRGLSEAL